MSALRHPPDDDGAIVAAILAAIDHIHGRRPRRRRGPGAGSVTT